MTKLGQFKLELQQELLSILEYWIKHSVDEVHGGFHGAIANDNVVDMDAPRGLVLNARILWTFSAAYNFTKEEKYLTIANRAYDYLITYFKDNKHGGYFWSVDKNGAPLETKKQVYGIAFCCYAFSEYYKACRSVDALRDAITCFDLIEEHAFDKVYGGYFEAFMRDWQPVADMRLSERDANEKKTMNTHLHILEAYTNLYSISPGEKLKAMIQQLLSDFEQHILIRQTKHLGLFFNEEWELRSSHISYGHDIEAAWLLMEAAKMIGDSGWINKTTGMSLNLKQGAIEGLDGDGGIWYEVVGGKLIKQKHWWPQAEAMVGFFNAWQISGNNEDLDRSKASWAFIRNKLIDHKNGEWFWGINGDGSVMEDHYKAGFWKGPYHNSRACMEMIKRLNDVN